MKRCPTCNRTYSDETISFCLDDGSLLSNAYDSEETLVLGADDPTVRNTSPGYTPEKPTETNYNAPRPTSSSLAEVPRAGSSPHLIYAGAGLIAVLTIVGGLVWLNASNRKDSPTAQTVQSNTTSNVANVNRATAPAPTPLAPKFTTPRGNIQNTGHGPFYRNFDNSLEAGVAYKYANDNVVYLYDGQYLTSVGSEKAFLEFYRCGSVPMIIDCAPIYELPSNVTPAMFRGSAPNRGTSNVPTVKQMQDDIEREVKKMVDEANR